SFIRDANAIFITLDHEIPVGQIDRITLIYHGEPIEAKRAPWDGGFTRTTDALGKPWMAVSCQGIGASLWWPCKDHLSDEPDSMDMHFTVPVAQTCISNGQERGITEGEDGYHTFHWHVSYPINNYNVTFNIGQYVHWHDVYTAQDGDTLSLDYYVKPENLEKSKKQFRQVKPMLSCYERYLGKYPFWKDGFALVETPYLGMEHQGAIAYGNKYMPGYMGWDRSGANLQFDYIIIHETGHEWWGNSVSCSDLADMWIHEGFCTYTEAIYVECMHGEKAAQGYVNALKQDVANRQPIIGTYGINREGHSDMYVKGMLFLNSLRHTIDDDALWWSTIKYVSDTAFKITSVDYEQLVQVFEKKSGQTLRPIFEQFVKYAALPVLEYELCGRKKDKIKYHWKSPVRGFNMPAILITNRGRKRIYPTTEWQEFNLESEIFQGWDDQAFYFLQKQK
ncbi:MAG: M1 family metallopeptidase, partial [Flavobacteriales bacterium]